MTVSLHPMTGPRKLEAEVFVSVNGVEKTGEEKECQRWVKVATEVPEEGVAQEVWLQQHECQGWCPMHVVIDFLGMLGWQKVGVDRHSPAAPLVNAFLRSVPYANVNVFLNLICEERKWKPIPVLDLDSGHAIFEIVGYRHFSTMIACDPPLV